MDVLSIAWTTPSWPYVREIEEWSTESNTFCAEAEGLDDVCPATDTAVYVYLERGQAG